MEATKTPAPASGGELAIEDIVIKEGETSFKPGPIVGDLQKAGIPAGAVQNARDVFECPQLKSREAFVKLEHPVIGQCNNPAPPMKFSRTPSKVRPAPCLGEHNHYVYTELLGMPDEEFVTLMNEGVFE